MSACKCLIQVRGCNPYDHNQNHIKLYTFVEEERTDLLRQLDQLAKSHEMASDFSFFRLFEIDSITGATTTLINIKAPQREYIEVNVAAKRKQVRMVKVPQMVIQDELDELDDEDDMTEGDNPVPYAPLTTDALHAMLHSWQPSGLVPSTNGNAAVVTTSTAVSF